MGKERPGIILLRRNAEAVAEMSVEEAGMLLKAIFAYDAGEEIPEMTPFARAVFCLIKADMKQHTRHYDEIVDRNRRNAQKRWDEKKDTSAPGPSHATACGRMQSDTSACECMRADDSHANYADDAKNANHAKRREGKRGEEKGSEENIYINSAAPVATACDRTDLADCREVKRVVQMLAGPDRERFDQFWCLYPRKECKARAEAIWGELRPDEILTQVILDAVRIACVSDPRFATMQYTPHPANWLARQEWRNEYVLPKKEEVDYGSWH